MCGICGYTGDRVEGTLDGMLRSLEHRGPDEVGRFEDDVVHLGVSRLAIIDRSGGQQPLANEDGAIRVAFNGEIFNYLQLRADLEARGHVFRTHTDGETVVHAYEEYGGGFAHRLNGMFAAAISDRRTGTTMLVRDRYGEKPVFYAIRSGTLIFGSEIKAVLRHPAVSRELDPEAIAHYFGLRHIPAPFTAYRDVRSLPPGHSLTWSGSSRRASVARWYDLPMRPAWTDADETELAAMIDDLLRDSVRLRLQSEVGVGAYLSGGVDSSTIVAIMSELSAARVKTFTLRFADDPPHKRDPAYARLVAERYATDHHECLIEAADLARELPEVIRHLDQPFAGVISSYWLSRFMRRHVTVALSGDGADDIFASYGHHRLVGPIAACRRATASGSPPLDEDLGFFADRPEYVTALAEQPIWKWRLTYAAFTDSDKELLWSETGRAWLGRYSTSTLLRNVYEEGDPSADDLNRMLYMDIRTLLPGEILYFNDMLSMAHSLEVRAPFLDFRLVELAASIPGTMKIRGRTLKYILGKVAARYVPPPVLARAKEGFVLPANTWLRDALAPLLDDVLSADRLARHGLYDPKYVRALRARFAAGDDGLTFKIWTLVVFQLWFEEHEAGQ
ncbi:MAG TPA: asparagine synthase (glutamine-hydrolyzing) [Vicinamibacterales bacterium]|nr:asparagine synthase (glutamine-hydrolyzing) [Vicinamibacterales bacterium]